MGVMDAVLDALLRWGIVLVGVFLVSALATIVVRYIVLILPADHFVSPLVADPVWLFVVRRIGGLVLIALGIIMLAAPGPGLITILLGVAALDGAMKHALAKWLLGRPRVRTAVNAMRARSGREPFVAP